MMMSNCCPWRRVAILAGSVLAALLAGCGQNKSPAPSGGGKAGRGGGVPPVLAGTVQRKVVPLAIEAIGAVEPIRTTAIRSQVTGTLLKIAFQEGQDVKEGDLLFEIDPRPFRNALKTAEADLQKVHLQLETARTQVARYQTLTEDKMVSKEQFEKINDISRSLEAEVLADEARVANAKLQLEYCSIRAPLAGRTGNRGVHDGDIVRANDSGMPLVTINQLSPIYVTFGVPQQYLATLTRYRASGGNLVVTVTPPGTDEKPELGELTFMDNTVDSSTGTLKLKGSFPNRDHRLWPGQFAQVSLTLASPEVLAVATSAIQTSQTGQHVYVVKPDKTAELRPVVVERVAGNDTVITRGLSEGEIVVVDGQLRVLPGKPVEVKEPPGGTSPRGGKGQKGKTKEKEKEKNPST